MAHNLIDLSSFPSMPAPMSSSTAGEAWVWGDFFAVLQVNATTVAHSMQKVMKIASHELPAVQYPFAMTVYYQRSKNPHGPSSRPILSITLETLSQAAILAQLGGNKKALKELGLDRESPPVKGLFNAEGRYNMGPFDQAVTLDNARDYFFTIMHRQLNLPGMPTQIGAIADIYGHPETGWPADGRPKAAKSGCVIFLAALGTGLATGCALLAAAFLS